ncbi:MAG: addiction module protein [Acidobacteria bacterium]|nr:addiction module protein [Acidobacteriota bacterium]
MLNSTEPNTMAISLRGRNRAQRGRGLVSLHCLVGLPVARYNGSMSDRAQALLREALSLSQEERADVAAELLVSLDEPVGEDPAVVQAAWAAEIEKRARRVLAGDSTGEPWDAVRDRVGRRLTER